jgi:hypothetical protein
MMNLVGGDCIWSGSDGQVYSVNYNNEVIAYDPMDSPGNETTGSEDGKKTGSPSHGINVDGQIKLTIGPQAGGDFSFGGRYGVFGNIASLTLLGIEYNNPINQETHLLYPGSQIRGFSQINQEFSAGYGLLSGGISHTFDGSLVGCGTANEQFSPSVAFGTVNKYGTTGLFYEFDPIQGINTLSVGFEAKVAFGIGLVVGFHISYTW